MIPLFGTFSLLVSSIEKTIDVISGVLTMGFDRVPRAVLGVVYLVLVIAALVLTGQAIAGAVAFLAAHAFEIAVLFIGIGVFLAALAVTYAVVRGDRRAN